MKCIYRYERCTPELPVPHALMPAVGKLYPYGTLYYTPLEPLTRDFLRREFVGMPGATEVIAISAHNGCGRQWGIILMRKPTSHWWKLVAQFGHGRHWRRFFILRCFLVRLVIATGFWDGHCYNHCIDRPYRFDEMRAQGKLKMHPV